MTTVPLISPPLAPTPRRSTIRFAPLPDPRRSVLITDDGTELPLSPFPLDFNPSDPYSPKVEGPSASALELLSIPAAISLSALNSPVHTPSHTPQTWNVPLPPSPSPSPAHFEKTLSTESDSSNSSGTSTSSSGSTSGSPPTSGLSSSASSMYSLTPTQSLDPYPYSAGSSTPTQAVRKSNSLASKLSSKYNISTEQVLTLGAINLFRSRSKGKDKERDSDADSVSSSQGGLNWGNPLSRWTSAGSTEPGREAGVPLYRTQSTQSYKGGNVRNVNPASLSGSFGRKSRSNSTSSKTNPARENGMLSTLHTGSSKKGTRMLNGRVYGAKRASNGKEVNLFANARDEPEFVEWGYGGMGSVKNVQDGVGGKVWGRVLSNGTGMYESKGSGEDVQKGSTRGSAPADDDDDGSGMGWVRRRKEAREREAKEKAEREAKEQAEKEQQEREAQEKADEPDVSDSRSISSTITAGTATSTHTAGTIRNIPTPLPLPDVGHLSPPPMHSAGSAGSPTPTLGTNVVTPIGTPRPRAIEDLLSPPPSTSNLSSDSTSPDIRSAPMSRQTSSGTATMSNISGASSPGKDEEHVLTAINIPAPAPSNKHHSHHHGHSRGKSLDATLKAELSSHAKNEARKEEEQESKAAIGESAVEDQVSPSTNDHPQKEERSEFRPRHDSASSNSSSASSTSSHSESESESESDLEKSPNDTDDEDDDEEESEDEMARKTVLGMGAGVEKISRHNKAPI